MKKYPITITLHPPIKNKEPQIQVIVYPEDSYYKFDCIRLKLREMKGDLKQVDITPDEALDIINLLSTGVSMFLKTDRNYKKFIDKEKKIKIWKHKKPKYK